MDYCYSHSRDCQGEFVPRRPSPEATKKETSNPKVKLTEIDVDSREFAGPIEHLVSNRSRFPDTGDV